MRATILTTKLYAPPRRDGLVSRPRLLARLDAGATRALTLVSAPAGFGKTTLVSEWLTVRGLRAAWLSLDPDDADPARFLAHLVAALQRVADGMGQGVAEALGAPQVPPVPWLLAELLNDLAAEPDDLVVVLDDVHVVEGVAIHETIGYLLDHLPPRVHLVLTSREDPPLRLAMLRARDQLVEVRAADLRFRHEEAAAFLEGGVEAPLSAEDVAALEARTEGWIAGLQLAALSLRGREDVAGFLRSFTGDHRYVVDYLVEEVLRGQPDRVRTFLLRTSVLERMCGPLCDAVTGQEEGAAMLDELERANLFLVPLDDRRHWYRYHQLFGDVLRAHLAQEHADDVADLHRRASAWYEAEGADEEAIRHAFAARDLDRAATLLERTWREMDSTFRSAAWAAWAEQLPGAVVQDRPALATGLAWAHLNGGDLEAADRDLTALEAVLPSSPDGGDLELRALAGTVASARAYQTLAVGDPGASLDHVARALALLPEGDAVARGVPLGVLSLAHWAHGDLEDAYAIMAQAMAGFRDAGNVPAAISGTFALVDLQSALGRARQAEAICEDAQRRLEEQPIPLLPGMAEVRVAWAGVRLERGDREGAERHLRAAEGLGERAVLPGDEARLHVAMALLEAELGNGERALELLERAERLRIPSPMPDLRPIAACRALVLLGLGRLDQAWAWARECDASEEQAPSFLREFERLVHARVMLAVARHERTEGAVRDAAASARRTLEAAEAGGRTGRAIEARVLLALALEVGGDGRAALEVLAPALAAAEPEGLAGPFLNGGAPMADLLRRAVQEGVGPGFARALLERLAGVTTSAARTGEASTPRGTAGDAGLIEPLTDRESEVLRMLATDQSGPEIARTLHVSLNTLRTHSKNLYGKLGANSRRTAVTRARELGLL